MKCSEPTNATIHAAQSRATGGSGRDFQSAGWIISAGMALPKISLKRKVELTRATLVPQLEALGQRAIPVRVVAVDIVQQATTATHHHE